MKLIGLLLIVYSVSGFAQKQGNFWVFGNGNTLDFNFDPPVHTAAGMISCGGSDICEGVASMADSSGNLLFYTNGKKVWNGDHQIVTNGDGLMGHTSSTNSGFILPFPERSGKYFIFTTDAWENGLANGLRYSIVDICGKGGVIVIEKNTFLRSSVTEKLAATRHANGTDYWLLAHEHATAKFLAYRISVNGIQLADSSTAGLIHPSNVQGAVGQMKISPSGDKLALTVSNTTAPGIELFDFDNATGTVSNSLFFNPDTLGGFPSSFYGVAFSPNGNLLYVAPPNDNKLIQLDIHSYLTSQDIVVNKYVVNSQPNIGQAFHQLQLGPDGRIYLARNTIGYLGVINNPNEVGVDCNFDIQGVDLLGNTSGWGLPAYIDSYDYTATGICDTGVGISEQPIGSSIEIYPNPTTGEVHFKLPNGVAPTAVEVYDMLGKRVTGLAYQPTVNVAGLPKGNYIIAVLTKERTYRQLLVVE